MILLFNRYRFLIYFIACLTLPFFANSQERIQMSIYAGESFSAHPDEEVSIYSDISNSGSFASTKDSKINFWGQRWENKAGSSMPDESSSGVDGTGGNFIFGSTASYSQYISSSYNPLPNSGFPNISLSNSKNVILEGSDLKIRNNLNFESGHLILNNRNALILAKASITGYDASKFIVTGTGVNGGFLIRSTLGKQQENILFPVGTTVDSYTPASLNYIGIAQNLKLRVFENVYDKAIYGINVHDNFVNKTWNLSSDLVDPNAKLTLNTQHNISDEGSQFAIRRNESFISKFQSITENWDIISATGLTPGVITSGNSILNAFVSSRTNISGLYLNEYFSKSVMKSNAIYGLRIPNGISPNNDGLNDRFIIENLKLTDKVSIDIYNRLQSLVFRDANYKNNFNGFGNQKGLVTNELPDGTYYYILNFNDSKPIIGYFIINR